MEPNASNATLLRIFIGESDHLDHKPLYEAILFAARRQGLAGCTVTKGIMSYGASTIVHTAKLIDISQDLPIIVEIIDEADKISRFADEVSQMLDKTGCGGLITTENINVCYYRHRSTK
jgi:PII-like signaling protein